MGGRVSRRQFLALAGAATTGASRAAVGGGAASERDLERQATGIEGTWPTFKYNNANTGYAADVSGPSDTVTTRWSATRGSGGGSGVVVVDNTVYVGSDDEQFYAFDATTGEEEWSATTDGVVTGTPAYHSGTLYAGSTDGTVHAIDADTGLVGWEAEVDGAVEHGVKVADGEIYVPTAAGTLFALGVEDGSEVWSLSLPAEARGTPAVEGDIIAVATEFEVLALSRTPPLGAEWRFRMTSRMESSPTIANDAVYLGSGEGKAYAVDLASGEAKWTLDTPPNVETSPSVDDDTAYVGGNEGIFFALDAETGEERWSRDIGTPIRAAPTVADGLVYFSDREGTLYALETDTGQEVWSFDLDGGDIAGSPAVLDDHIFVGTVGTTAAALTPPGNIETPTRTPSPTPTPTEPPAPDTDTPEPTPTETPPPTDTPTDSPTDERTVESGDDDFGMLPLVGGVGGAVALGLVLLLKRRRSGDPGDAGLGGGNDGSPGSGGPLGSSGGGGALGSEPDSAPDSTASSSEYGSGGGSGGATASTGGSAGGSADATASGDEGGAAAAGSTGAGTEQTECGECGTTIESDASVVFCPECGHELGEDQDEHGDHAEEADDEQDDTSASADGTAGSGAADDALADAIPGIDRADRIDDERPVHVYSAAVADDADIEAAGGVGDTEVWIYGLDPELAGDDDAERAFNEAAASWNGISHNPHISTVIDHGKNPRPWIAFDNQDHTFADVQAELDPKDQLRVLFEAADAFRRASLYKVTHGNVTPKTIHFSALTTEGASSSGAISDWGITAGVEAAVDDPAVTSYTAPEQLEDGDFDKRTDVYQLGALAYEIVTGGPLYDDADDLEEAILDGDPTLSGVKGDVPEEIMFSIERALHREPADRYDSPISFQNDVKDRL